MGGYTWYQSVPVVVGSDGLCHLFVRVEGYNPEGINAEVDLLDSAGTQVDYDDAYLGVYEDDRTMLIMDNLPAGAYTVKLSLYSTSDVANNWVRVKFDGPGTGPAAAPRRRVTP